MSKSTSPDWILNGTWAVSRNKYNWILQARKGSRWRAVGYYPTPQLLLKSLQRKIARTMPAQTDLIDHLQVAYEAGERLSDTLSAHVLVSFGDRAKLTPQQAAAIESGRAV